MSFILPSNEAIAFQSNSAIGLALEKVFQEVIDYRDSLPEDRQIKETVLFVKKTMKPKMIEAFKKNLNITIENIILYAKEITGVFAVNLDMGNGSVINLLDASYGEKKLLSGSASKDLEELMNLYKYVDKNGVFYKEKFNTKDVFAILHMDVISAFLSKFYIDSKVIEPFTAKELAAIYLHEIGHFTSMIQRFKYDCFIFADMENRINSIAVNYTPKDVATAFIDNKSKLEKIIKQIDNNYPYKNKLLSLVDTVTKGCNTILYFEQTMQDNPNSINKTYLVLKLLFKSIVFICECIVKIVFFSFSFWNVYVVLDDEMSLNKSVKLSDNKDTLKSTYYMEKDADEYTIRSGYGQYQASALAKLRLMFEIVFDSGIPDIKHLAGLTDLINLNLMFTTQIGKKIFYSYEGDLARIKRLAQMTIPIFKNLPEESKYRFINQYEGIIKEVNKMEKLIDNPVEKITKFIDYITSSPYKFIRNLLIGSVSNDYLELQDQVEELINNKLYYYGVKFKETI